MAKVVWTDPYSGDGHCSECNARLPRLSNRKTCRPACARARKMRRQTARRWLREVEERFPHLPKFDPLKGGA